MRQAICNGRLVLPDQVLEGMAVVFEDTISAIVPEGEVPADVRRIDAGGRYVLPGLVDIHIHGSGGCDTMDGTREALDTISRTIARNGVTRFLATSVTMPLEATGKVFQLVRQMQGTGEGAILEGVNMEGPFISPIYKGAHEENYITGFDFEFVRSFQDVIRTVTVAPEKPGGMEFIRRVTSETPVRVSLGHTNATYQQALEAIAAGASNITHLYNAMTPMHHRKPGVVTAALTQQVTTEMICDTIHVHPALFSFVMDCKTGSDGVCDRFVLITDCMRAGGMPEGEYTLGELKVLVDGTSARLEDGTLAGSILTLNRAVANVLRHTGRPIWQVVRAASLNPANAMGMGERLGSIQVGKAADFAIADEEMAIHRTIVAGRTVFCLEEQR